MAKFFFYLGILVASLINITQREFANKEESKTELTQSVQLSETLKD